MNIKRFGLTILFSALIVSAGALALTSQDQDAMPSASSEHELLMESVGTWDAAMKMWMGPGEPMSAQGTEVNRAVGPFHVVSDFKADMMGMDFDGHGISSWDPTKKKFITIWVDSTEPTPGILEGTHDEKTKTMTFKGEMMMMGERMKVRQVITMKDAEHRTFDMFITPPGGEEMQSMHIDYTKKK
ncbi:MAG: DUF1579 domain-containing protein [Planctomycetota bacterium]